MVEPLAEAEYWLGWYLPLASRPAGAGATAVSEDDVGKGPGRYPPGTGIMYAVCAGYA